MENDHGDNRNQSVTPKSENAENRAPNARGNACHRYDPCPFPQLQHTNRQTGGNASENQKRKSSRDSHSVDGSGYRLSSIFTCRAHHRDEKETERAQSQNRRSAERQNRDDCHTRGAFHAHTSPQTLRIADEAGSRSSSRLQANDVTFRWFKL